MRGSLGEKLGEGFSADIHAWAPGQVVKLFKAAVAPRAARHEARVTRAAFAAGCPAPEVLGEVTLDGRFGIVLSRLDGPTLTQSLLTGAATREQAGAILAALYRTVHETTAPPGIPSLSEWFDAVSAVPGGMPTHIAPGVLSLIERLPPATGLCHGDLHPDNVIMTAEGPTIIDWVAAVRAPAAYDLGRCHVILSELIYAPDDVDPRRPRALNAIVQSEYARLAGMSAPALTAAIEHCLPILRAFALADSPINPARRERLIQSVEASLRSAELI
jgi:streptomycin 6-kinase